MEQKIESNLLKIKEADFYMQSFMKKEDCDFKVFSPRNAETVYKEEIEKAKNERETCCYENQNLMHDKNILALRIKTLEQVIEQEKVFSGNLAVLKIQEEDRHRIARELHDTSLQNLAHLVHKIELSTLFIDQDPVRAKLELSVVNKNIKEIIEEIRNTIYDLRPMSFDDLGLRAAFERLFENINENNKYEIDFTMEDVSCENELVLLTIYRVVKECINNITKHADADKIIFCCKTEHNKCMIEIEDNGKGFDETLIKGQDNKHFGISFMRERITLLGGKIDIYSHIGIGTKIEIEVPLP